MSRSEADTRLLMDASFAAPEQLSQLIGREEHKARLSTDSSVPCFQWVAQDKKQGPHMCTFSMVIAHLISSRTRITPPNRPRKPR